MDGLKEAIGMSLQDLSRAIEDRTFGHYSFIRLPRVIADSMAHSIQSVYAHSKVAPLGEK